MYVLANTVIPFFRNRLEIFLHLPLPGHDNKLSLLIPFLLLKFFKFFAKKLFTSVKYYNYTINIIWCMLDMNENIVTRKFLTHFSYKEN